MHVGIETAFGCIIAMFLLFSSQLRRTAMQFVGENVTGHTLIFVLLIVGSRKSSDTAATFGEEARVFSAGETTLARLSDRTGYLSFLETKKERYPYC